MFRIESQVPWKEWEQARRLSQNGRLVLSGLMNLSRVPLRTGELAIVQPVLLMGVPLLFEARVELKTPQVKKKRAS